MRIKAKRTNASEQSIEPLKISGDLKVNEANILAAFEKCSDLVIRRFSLSDSITCLAVYLSVLIDESQWNEGVLEPLQKWDSKATENAVGLPERLKVILPFTAPPEILESLEEVVHRVIYSGVVLFFDSHQTALAIPLTNQKHRQLEEPKTEAVIRGPRYGFVEDLSVNLALLRQIIRSPQLKIERLTVGKLSKTDVAVVYVEGYAVQSLVEEIKNRISKIDMDTVIESGYIEELVRDHPYSPFPTSQATERPDTAAASLVVGRVLVLVNGTPMTLLMPITFWYGFQSVEDYYMSFLFGTVLRWLRFLFAFFALVLPSVYVAITTFHQEMIPTSLALSLANAREIVPFPAMIEILMMEATFEALREAGVRLPRPVGQTISIVGALVIGQAAVQAGIISAPIIIVVAMTGIASFLIPHTGMSQVFSILRFPLVILGGTLGLYGVSAGVIAILIHLSQLESLGLPYLWPLAPFNRAGLEDVFARAPWQFMSKRQQHIQLRKELEKR
ncbi:spore germination protein [Cohnella sp. REN36]|uniref:spore germination protein n=1 Tax=Cohnella sp. REN36 TaxID=2887347 RepID=UPI001D14E8FD|nr:spore germination protein [Cohnella sp. REN36]MCC3373965.1 spore germination protein [Cohnella sp. REN36]